MWHGPFKEELIMLESQGLIAEVEKRIEAGLQDTYSRN